MDNEAGSANSNAGEGGETQAGDSVREEGGGAGEGYDNPKYFHCLRQSWARASVNIARTAM